MQPWNVIFSLNPEAAQAVAGRGLQDLECPQCDNTHIPAVGDCVVFDAAAGAPLYQVSGRVFAVLPDGRRAVFVHLDYLADVEAPLVLPGAADDEEWGHG